MPFVEFCLFAHGALTNLTGLRMDTKQHAAMFTEADRRTMDGTTQLTAEDLMGWSKAREMADRQGINTQSFHDRPLSFQLPDSLTLHCTMLLNC